MNIGSINVIVKNGNIAEEKVDCIVGGVIVLRSGLGTADGLSIRES